MALLEWQNLIFVLPMLAALLYVLLMASGLGLGEHDVDVDHDIHVEIEHDVDVEHNVFAGDGDPGHVASDGHALAPLLALLGIGKVPVSILMISLFMIWGAAGLVLKAVFGVDAMLQVVGFTALAALVGTRLLAEGLSYVMPREESYHTPREELVGEMAEVLYEITPTAGTARLCDPTGNLLDLDCRSRGQERIPAGTPVMLAAYDPAADLFIVEAWNGETTTQENVR